MRKIVAIAALTVAVAGPAAVAHGPSGSYEGDRYHRYQNNNVRCGSGRSVSALRTKAYASSSRGAEVCKDGGAVPVQGRFIVDRRKQYVGADGDRNNAGPARGYARVDRSGPHCSQGRDQDSAHSRTAGKPTTCNGR